MDSSKTGDLTQYIKPAIMAVTTGVLSIWAAYYVTWMFIHFQLDFKAIATICGATHINTFWGWVLGLLTFIYKISLVALPFSVCLCMPAVYAKEMPEKPALILYGAIAIIGYIILWPLLANAGDIAWVDVELHWHVSSYSFFEMLFAGIWSAWLLFLAYKWTNPNNGLLTLAISALFLVISLGAGVIASWIGFLIGIVLNFISGLFDETSWFARAFEGHTIGTIIYIIGFLPGVGMYGLAFLFGPYMGKNAAMAKVKNNPMRILGSTAVMLALYFYIIDGTILNPEADKMILDSAAYITAMILATIIVGLWCIFPKFPHKSAEITEN